jgi:hypothetical protein
MKNVKQDQGMPPSSGMKENAKTNANMPAPQSIFDYADTECEDKDRVDRLKHGHDDCNYSQYNGSL